MASVSLKTDEIVDEKLEEKKEVDDIKLDDDKNIMIYSATVSEEKPVSKNVPIVESLKKSGEIKESETLESSDAEVQTGIPKEQKKESSDAVVPDVSEATKNDDLNASTSIEVPMMDLEVQSAFLEEQKQEKIKETQEQISNEAIIDSGCEVVQSSSHDENDSEEAEAIKKKEESSEEITDNPVGTLEAQTEVAQNSTDVSAAEVSSDQARALKTVEMVDKENDTSFNIEKDGIEASVKDHNIVPEASEVPSKDKEISACDERKSESLQDVDETSVKAPKEFATVEVSLEQVIKENMNESSNEFETLGSLEMVEDKKNDSKDHSLVEKNVQILDDKKEETQLEEPIKIAIDKSEKKGLGAEKEESQKSKDVDPIVSSDTTDTKLIKEPSKHESNNFLSKAKRSIVKAKKAILGKSPGPKTMSS